jgi:hypothetical protein
MGEYQPWTAEQIQTARDALLDQLIPKSSSPERTDSLGGIEMFPPECERHGPMELDYQRYLWSCREPDCWTSLSQEALAQLDRSEFGGRRFVVIVR